MAINQPGVAITIKAFLPTGKTLDEQFEALSIVKTAHETSDYSALLQAAHDVEVKTESKTRRIEVEETTAPEQAETLVQKAQRLGLPWKGISDEALRENFERCESLPPKAPAADLPDPAPVEQDNQTEAAPWADNPPESKPAGRKRAGVGDL